MHSNLWTVLCGIITLASAQEHQVCTTSISKEGFHSFVSGFTQCDAGAGMTTFQDDVDIVNQVFDLDGTFDINGLSTETITSFCREVANCKGVVTTCESEMQSFVENAGMALCQNGVAVTREIQKAADTLSKENCNVDFEPVGLSYDGCYIGPDSGNPPTYLEYIVRLNKLRSAEDRCYYRYLEANNICPPASIAALATIYAASRKLENIGRDFDAYIKYQKPELGADFTSVTMRGFTHLYMNGARQTTCKSLSNSNILLWNTYIRIDGTTSGLNPMADTMLLTSILVQFSNTAGQVFDSYMTSVTDKPLQHQTVRQQAPLPTKVGLSIDGGVVTLTHTELEMEIVISTVGQALSVSVTIPTSVYELETVGVLVDGCETFGGVPIADLRPLRTSECITSCTMSEVPSKYVDECAYDCANGLQNYIGAHKMDLTSGGVQKSLINTLTMLMSSLLLLVGSRYL